MTQGWTCPKCGRVYGPNVDECAACNKRTQYPLGPSKWYQSGRYAAGFCTCGRPLFCSPAHDCPNPSAHLET